MRFSHPLPAGAARSLLDAAGRRRVRGRLAELTSGEERARHLAAIGSPAATEALVTTAGEPRDRGAPCAAAQLLEQALTELPAGPERARALAVLGEVRHKTGSFAAAREVLEQAHVEAAGDERLLLLIELRLMFTLFNLAEPEAATAHIGAARARGERLGDPELLAQALATGAVADYRNGGGIDREQLRRATEPARRGRPAGAEFDPDLVAAIICMWAGELESAEASLAAATAAWTAAGEEAAPAEMGLAMVAVERGEAAAARAACDRAEALFERCQWRASLPWAAIARGRLALSQGDAETALAALESLLPLALAELPPEPTANGSTFAGDVAEALIACGRLEEAERVVAGLERRGAALDRPWAIAVGHRGRGSCWPRGERWRRPSASWRPPSPPMPACPCRSSAAAPCWPWDRCAAVASAAAKRGRRSARRRRPLPPRAPPAGRGGRRPGSRRWACAAAPPTS